MGNINFKNISDEMFLDAIALNLLQAIDYIEHGDAEHSIASLRHCIDATKVLYHKKELSWDNVQKMHNISTSSFKEARAMLEMEDALIKTPNLSIEDVQRAFRDVFEETGEYNPSPGAIRMKLVELQKDKLKKTDG